MFRFFLLFASALLLFQGCAYLITQRTLEEYAARHGAHPKQKESALKLGTQCNKLELSDQPNAYAYSGYLQAFGEESESAFGFIFYGSQLSKGDAAQFKKYPTLIWLQGGPGSSSQFGNFLVNLQAAALMGVHYRRRVRAGLFVPFA